VRFAQDPVDRCLVVGRCFERNQPGRDPLQVALCLLDEQWTELVL